MHPEPSPYPPSAIVRLSGGLEEVDGATGKRLLEDRPELVRYGLALLGSERRQARFFWWEPDGVWLRITIEKQGGGPDGEPHALVTLSPESLPFGLTGRELDVLTLVGGGLNNREIAQRLETSVRTVSSHIEHILAKLGQRSRAGAGAMAVDLGIMRLPVPGGGAGLEALTVGMLDVLAGGSAPRLARLDRRPARTRRPFLIGSALPLTGPASADGAEMRNGTALAIQEINARGGIAGRRVEHVVVPTDIFDPERIRQAFEALISAEVDAITTAYFFAEEVALELAAQYGAPYLHAQTSETLLQRVRANPRAYARVFQVCPSEVHYGRGFVRFLDELTETARWRPHRRTVMFIETPLESGQMATSTTLEAAERSGWSVGGIHYVPATGADWDAVVELVHRADPGAVLVTDFLPSELAGFQRAFAARPTPALVYAVYTPSVPEFLKLAGPAAEGLVWSTVTGTYGDPVGSQFMSRYARAFGRPPGRSHAGIAYDEVHLLAQAWATVGNPRDFRAVADRLRRAVYRGVNGSYFLDNEGQSGLAYPDMTLDPSLAQAHLVFQVQGGRHRILSPPPYVEAGFRAPSWWRTAATA